MDNTFYFARVKEDAKIPYKRAEDGGYDIYACFEEDYIAIPPHEIALIPTGIASSFPDEYVVILKERGSTGTKNMALRAGVLDSGFRNEWIVPIANNSDVWMFISKIPMEEVIDKRSTRIGNQKIIDRREDSGIYHSYDKAICQALILPVPKINIVEIPYEELKNIPSERGTGMLGSSGK